MTNKSEEFMAACARTPAQVCAEHMAEAQAEMVRLEDREKETARKIDDYIYSTLEPYAGALIGMYGCFLVFNDVKGYSWSVPVCKSREEYDRHGGITDPLSNNVERTRTRLIRNWPNIKSAFHKRLEHALNCVADKMRSEAESLNAREEAVESFRI